MSNKRYSTPKDVIKELDYDYFNPYNTDIERVLLSLEKKDPFDQQIEFSGQCLRRFWEKYSRRHIAKILESFPRIQRALFGLEEDISEGTRYRDHYIHMFEVFITGSRIISQILSTIPENEIDKFILKTFKTTREPKDLPFPNPYWLSLK